VSRAADSLSGSLGGDPVAREELVARIYEDLRKLAASRMDSERADHTLQPTALAHEAFLRMIDQEHVDLRSRTHFLALAATMMRRVLVDHARARRAEKRGGSRRSAPLDEELGVQWQDPTEILALDEALIGLARAQPRQARVVELRFFGGLGLDETAQELGVSRETVKLDWRFARAWLNRALAGSEN
jgi:RNA polymerase sigma-70 factor (ECF subfamily)